MTTLSLIIVGSLVVFLLGLWIGTVVENRLERIRHRNESPEHEMIGGNPL